MLTLVIFALLSALLLAACQSQTSEEAAPASDQDTTAEEAPAEEEAAPEEEAPAEEEADTDMASSGVEGCDIVPPSEEAEINMIGWSFPITDFYADELMKCDQLENLTVAGSAGGDMVTAKVNGKMELLNCQLSDEAARLDDREMVEDLIVAAVNDALAKVRQSVAEETAKTGGLGLPGMGP